jgi:hypothetical protein
MHERISGLLFQVSYDTHHCYVLTSEVFWHLHQQLAHFSGYRDLGTEGLGNKTNTIGKLVCDTYSKADLVRCTSYSLI